MARVPRVIRRATTQASVGRPEAGHGWAALATLATATEEFIRPMALEEAREQGADAVYRDDDGKLRVDPKSMLGGKWAEVHNTTAFAAYLGQSRVDIRENLTELRTKYQYDPGAFNEASELYIKHDLLENAPAQLKADLELQARSEQVAMFDGLRAGQIRRNNSAADQSSKAARAMVAQDVVSMVQNGVSLDDPRILSSLSEIASITAFRENSAFIGETEAEGQAFLRSLLGAAKTEEFVLEIRALGGVDNITPEKRAELDARIKDMDIDPGARQKMYGLLSGELKRIDAHQFVQGITADDYEAKSMRAESGGDPNAKTNVKGQTASGLFGFTDKTYLRFAARLRDSGHPLFEGKSKAQLMAQKNDTTVQRLALREFRAYNQKILTGFGLPINDTNEYIMHHFGEGEGIKILKADPTTPLKDVVRPVVIRKHKHLTNSMTVGDTIAFARRKMTVGSSDMPAMVDAINGIEDPEVRGLAMREAQQWYQTQRLAEREAAEAYQLRLARDEPITIQEVLDDPALNDSTQASIVGAIESRNAVATELVTTAADMAAGRFFSSTDVKDRNRVDAVYRQILGDADPLSQEGIQAAQSILESEGVGFIPKTFFAALQGATRSQNPEIVSRAMEVGSQILSNDANRNAFAPHPDSEDFVADVAEYEHELRMLRDPQDAATRMIERRMIGDKEDRGRNAKAANELAAAITDEDLAAHFSDMWGSPGITEPMRADLMSMFRREFKNEYLTSGDAEIAQVRAAARAKRAMGVSNLAGEERLMWLPPEHYYPPVNGGHEYLSEDLHFATAEAIEPNHGKHPAKIIPQEDIYLLPDDDTLRDIAAGRLPSYTVYYLDPKSGAIERVVPRWYGDPRDAIEERDRRNRSQESDLDDLDRVMKERRNNRPR